MNNKMQKQSAGNVTKKSRAPKATNVQIDFLLSYMEDHNDFATGKLLGARGKAAHDAQWQRLITTLNDLNGPSKSMDAWKKLWCDQRNQARARAAKGKAQRQTGNIGKQIEVKDSDLRILSIIGGESSIGLPIMEVGVGKRLEDTVDPSLVLGLKNNTTREKDLIDDDISYEETNVLTSNKENINITDDGSIIFQDFVHEEDFSQPNDKCDDSFYIETMNYLQNTQDKQNKSSEAMVENLHRIASAVEQQNNFVEKSLALYEQTLQILTATVKDLTEKM